MVYSHQWKLTSPSSAPSERWSPRTHTEPPLNNPSVTMKLHLQTAEECARFNLFIWSEPLVRERLRDTVKSAGILHTTSGTKFHNSALHYQNSTSGCAFSLLFCVVRFTLLQFEVILCIGPVHDEEFLKIAAFILKAGSLHFRSFIGSSQRWHQVLLNESNHGAHLCWSRLRVKLKWVLFCCSAKYRPTLCWNFRYEVISAWIKEVDYNDLDFLPFKVI